MTTTTKKHLDSTMIGVEIEFERGDRFSSSSKFNQFWRMEGDGSLRNEGREIVFREPFSGDNARTALALAEKSTAKCAFTDRCGLHVHIDCRDLKPSEVNSVILTYLLFEPVIFPVCGAGRENSNFSVPLWTNKQLLRDLGSGAHINRLSNRVGGEDRYAALNLGSYERMGSLEFRAMRGTGNAKLIEDWAEILLSIRAYGRTRPDFREMIKRSSEAMPEQLFSEVFNDDLCDTIFRACGSSFLERLLQGARTLQYVLHSKKPDVCSKLLERCKLRPPGEPEAAVDDADDEPGPIHLEAAPDDGPGPAHAAHGSFNWWEQNNFPRPSRSIEEHQERVELYLNQRREVRDRAIRNIDLHRFEQF